VWPIERALCPVLIGRDEQLSQLEDALLAAHRGEGQVVLLGGEAGMGKTRLASELQKRALKSGTTVMWGGCSEAELALPYLPFLEAIGNYLRNADLKSVREQLGHSRRELALLFPKLGGDLAPADTGDPIQNKLRLFEAVLELLNLAAAQSGLLVVLEDLHWADASTRELLDYLTRQLRNTRIMVLGTYRQDELHRKHPLLAMVQGWRRAGAASILGLAPLPPARVADMVAAIFDEPTRDDTRDFLHARTEGNPLSSRRCSRRPLTAGISSERKTGGIARR
jgi:predicted ATPase